MRALQRDPLLFGAVVRDLLDYNFEPSLHDDICTMAGIDIEALEVGTTAARTRDPAFGTRSSLLTNIDVLFAATRVMSGTACWAGGSARALVGQRRPRHRGERALPV